MRVVLDTNILASAFISEEGYPARVLATIKRERVTLVTSAYQIEELRGVLAHERLKPYIRPEEATDLLYHLEAVGLVVSELPEVSLSPDPTDNPMPATAIAGEAELIVSGDKGDMLALGRVEGIPVVTAREAAARLQQRTTR